MKVVASLLLVGALVVPVMSSASKITAAASCTTGLTLTLQPGLPASVKHGPLSVAPDLPRGPFHVAVPVYPTAEWLSQFVASPVPEYPASPYLQTGVAEYRAPDGVETVREWYRSAFAGCGWKVQGTMATNASILTSGITFVSAGDRNLTVEMTFGAAPNGGTYIAYAAEKLTFPPRPAWSYLRGPFTQLRIVARRGTLQNGRPLWHVSHTVVADASAIARLVSTINSISDYHTTSGICLGGGLSLTGPFWISFVRSSGSVVHAFEAAPGPCGGLAVNGARWLNDDGRVWNLMKSMAGSAGQTATGGKVSTGTSESPHPWIVRRVLAVGNVAGLCASHAGSRFIASVQGFLTAMPLQGPGGGFVGRLFAAPNPHAFFAGDTKPFVQVRGTRAWDLRLNGRQVIFHGILKCDGDTYVGELAGWQGSIVPDRYALVP